MSIKQIIAFIITPIISIVIIAWQPLHADIAANNMAAVALLMAVWWMTEIVPLAVTALLPVVLFPFLGIMDGKDTSSTYYNYIIFLFIGGFIIALALQKWHLHKRIALKILMLTGTSPAKILLGFMLATAFLSMWISNTATTMMMLPILLSVITNLENIYGKERLKLYSIGLLLGVAYSSSIGGIATLIGTPPNPIFAQIYIINFPNNPEISFSQWMVFALPLSTIMFAIMYTLLYFLFAKGQSKIWHGNHNVDFKADYLKLGKASYEEKIVFVIFISTAILWMTRSALDIGNFHFAGWASLFPYPKYLNDGTIAVSMSLLLFLIPSKKYKGHVLMDWETVKKMPWGIILLFGGGFALASGFKVSGLSTYLGNELQALKDLHPLIIIFAASTIMIFLTELTSNSSSTTMILPILASLAVSTNIHPLMLMLPATFAASMAFMLPVATPPNAIVFGSNRLQIKDMARTGLILNIVGIMVISLWTYFFAGSFFGF
jgi:sodium-dependent dicarboxylate transporter 2/3/5